jgi:hypothetical protein
VRAVNAVKVADADDRRTEVRGDVGELVKDFHRCFSRRRDAEITEKILISVFLGALGISAVNLNLKLQLHPVIRQLHTRRQRCIGRLVRQVMADVSKKRALRFHLSHNLQ